MKRSYKVGLVAGAGVIVLASIFLLAWSLPSENARSVTEHHLPARQPDSAPALPGAGGAIGEAAAHAVRSAVPFPGYSFSVREAGGGAVSGVVLARVERAESGVTEVGESLAVSDASGVLRYDGQLVPRLFLLHPEHIPFAVSEALPSGTMHEVRMERGCAVKIKAVDLAGKPIAGVVVTVSQLESKSIYGRISREDATDREGVATLAGLRRGAFTLDVESDVYIVENIHIGAAAPTHGTVVLRRPLVAFGEARAPLDSFVASHSISMVMAGLTPRGPAQMSAVRFTERLRQGSTNRVAVVALGDSSSLPRDAYLEVRYLSAGEWGVARIPFRAAKKNMQPVKFGRLPVGALGQLCRFVIRTPDGGNLPSEQLKLRVAPVGQASPAHAVIIGRRNQEMRLPRGKYELRSGSPCVMSSLGECTITIDEDDASEQVRVVEVKLKRHLAIVTPRVRGAEFLGNADVIDSGSVAVRFEKGGGDVTYFRSGLSQAPVLLTEGLNVVSVRSLTGCVREFQVRLSKSGVGVVDGSGKIDWADER